MTSKNDEKSATNSTGMLLLVGCLTLGLAPFRPEPHLFGKIRWVLGGAEGMQVQDWADLVMHGLPFVLLLGWLVTRLMRGRK